MAGICASSSSGTPIEQHDRAPYSSGPLRSPIDDALSTTPSYYSYNSASKEPRAPQAAGHYATPHNGHSFPYTTSDARRPALYDGSAAPAQYQSLGLQQHRSAEDVSQKYLLAQQERTATAQNHLLHRLGPSRSRDSTNSPSQTLRTEAPPSTSTVEFLTSRAQEDALNLNLFTAMRSVPGTHHPPTQHPTPAAAKQEAPHNGDLKQVAHVSGDLDSYADHVTSPADANNIDGDKDVQIYNGGAGFLSPHRDYVTHRLVPTESNNLHLVKLDSTSHNSSFSTSVGPASSGHDLSFLSAGAAETSNHQPYCASGDVGVSSHLLSSGIVEKVEGASATQTTSLQRSANHVGAAQPGTIVDTSGRGGVYYLAAVTADGEEDSEQAVNTSDPHPSIVSAGEQEYSVAGVDALPPLLTPSELPPHPSHVQDHLPLEPHDDQEYPPAQPSASPSPNRYLVRPSPNKAATITLDDLHRNLPDQERRSSKRNVTNLELAQLSKEFANTTSKASPSSPSVSATTTRLNNVCVVCFSREQTHAAIPCGHLCLCDACHSVLNACPICRAPVTSFARIYRVT
ncbi:unnamed protein product [Amoebophrya sp. A25]|nr:unnamed protein product [Amoebophrya sp. A25]|eukprot:GSA25T00011284001.1